MSAELVSIKGFQVVLYPTQHDVATVRFIFRAGSMLENKEAGEWGVAHFLEHMFFKGTEKRHYEEVNRILAKLGSVNAYTSNATTTYFVDCLPKNIKGAAKILSEMVFTSSLPDDEIEKERGTILEEWQTSQDDPISYFNGVFMTELGGDTFHPILGTKENIEGIQRDHIIGFKKKHYNKGSMMLAIVGKFDRDAVIKDLEEILSDYEDFPEGTVSELQEFHGSYKSHSFEHNSEQAVIEMFYPDFTLKESRETNFANNLFNNAIGGGMHSMMFNRIREKRGLAYSTGSFSWGVPQQEFWIPYVMTGADNVDACIQEINGILLEVAESGLDEDLFETAGANLMFDDASGKQTIGSVAKNTVDMWFELRDFIGTNFLTSEEFNTMISKVTNDDMKKIAQKYVDGDSKLVVMNGGKE